VIESKPDNALDDLRLHKPWPQLPSSEHNPSPLSSPPPMPPETSMSSFPSLFYLHPGLIIFSPVRRWDRVWEYCCLLATTRG